MRGALLVVAGEERRTHPHAGCAGASDSCLERKSALRAPAYPPCDGSGLAAESHRYVDGTEAFLTIAPACRAIVFYASVPRLLAAGHVDSVTCFEASCRVAQLISIRRRNVGSQTDRAKRLC